METNKYEYTIISKAGDLGRDASTLSANQLAIELANGGARVMKLMEEDLTQIGAQWELISHDVVVVGRKVVLTFLVRRPRSNTTAP